MRSDVAYMCHEDFIDVNLVMEHIGSIVWQIEKGKCNERHLGYRHKSC